MENEFKITDAIMDKADTYIPLALKEAIANDMARACVKPTGMIRPFGEKAEDGGDYGIPALYCESAVNKARVLLTVIMALYLHLWGEDTKYLCDIEEYDKWAGAHVLNQLERFKAGKYREKAFDLLADYREMEKCLNGAIYAVLRELNDPVKRFMEAFGAMASAEAIQSAMETIKEAQAGIEEERERQERIIHGEEPEESGEGEEVAG